MARAERDQALLEDRGEAIEIPNEHVLLVYEKRLQELLYWTKRFNTVARSAREQSGDILDGLAACIRRSRHLSFLRRGWLLSRVAVCA
jgi:hypothetical protein